MNAECVSFSDEVMNRRFALRPVVRIADRLEKSPNITACDPLANHLHIHYAPQDETVLPFIRDSFVEAYACVKSWFDLQDGLALALWMAPEGRDLQYMVCILCSDSYFFAPGNRDGINIVTFTSPRSCRMNQDKIRMTSLLAHEITHHVVRTVSQASVDSTTRKENRDVPMWLEEGLCQVLQCQLRPSLDKILSESMNEPSQRYALEELWNDLSSCPDSYAAYAQAYCVTKMLLQKKGKADILRLLVANRDRKTDWCALTTVCSTTGLNNDR